MNKMLKRFLSVLLCLSLVFASSSLFSTVEAADKIQLPPNMKVAFDKFINVSIDVIHRAITVFRFPWNPNPNKTVDMDKFQLTFADEFDDLTYFYRHWGHLHTGVRKGGYWDPAQTTLEDGHMVTRCEYKENGTYGPGYYADRVETHTAIEPFEQKYGYFEVSCKLPAAQGIWSAFWMSSANVNDFVPGKQGTEIDIFESPLYYRKNLGLNNNLITSNLHYGGYNLGHRYANVTVAKVNNPYTEFNTYGMEWNPDGYTFYINGQQTGHSKFGGVSEVPEYLILSMEVDGVGGKPYHGWSGIVTKNKDGELPAALVVDYVRVYQYKDLLAG